MYEPRLEAEALSEVCRVPTVRLDHAARVGQPRTESSSRSKFLGPLVVLGESPLEASSRTATHYERDRAYP